MRLWSSLQRFRLGRLIVALVLAVVLLQLVHMMLLTRLEAREGGASSLRALGGGSAGESPGVGGRQLQGRTVSHVVLEMSERVSNSYRLDKSGTYHVIDNFLTSEHVVLENDHDVTVVTQCSANHLHHLVALSERWKGPISVAVFTYDDDFVTALRDILYLHFCRDSVFRYVTFHLAFPISRSPKDVTAAAKAAEAWLSSCAPQQQQPPQAPPAEGGAQAAEGAAQGEQGAASLNYAVRGVEYPHNMLRNLAINYVQTRYVFVADVDMLPSQDLRPQFRRLLARLELDNRSSSLSSSFASASSSSLGAALSSSLTLSPASSLSSSSVLPLSKRAFVVPSFELKEGEAVPATKSQLLTAWSRGVARPFYSQLCAKCQRPTDYPRWKDAPGSPYGDLRIAYSVRWADPWEPFYIAAASLPLYDERFKQYGFNRISQVCEMHVAGYEFDVLDNAFVVHQGFKSRHGFHATKEQEQNANRQLFRKFKGELETKYPESPRRC